MKTIHFKNGSTLEIDDKQAQFLFKELYDYKFKEGIEFILFFAPNGVEIDTYVNVKEIVFID